MLLMCSFEKNRNGDEKDQTRAFQFCTRVMILVDEYWRHLGVRDLKISDRVLKWRGDFGVGKKFAFFLFLGKMNTKPCSFVAFLEVRKKISSKKN